MYGSCENNDSPEDISYIITTDSNNKITIKLIGDWKCYFQGLGQEDS
jgi:hypothetical protein